MITCDTSAALSKVERVSVGSTTLIVQVRSKKLKHSQEAANRSAPFAKLPLLTVHAAHAANVCKVPLSNL